MSQTWVQLIVAVLSSGGVVGAVVMLLKLRPESGQIVVSAAQGALVVQSGVIDTLRAESHRLQEENQQLRARVTALELEQHQERAEREQERERMAELERRLAALTNEVREDKV